jgi:hypothetical protein
LQAILPDIFGKNSRSHREKRERISRTASRQTRHVLPRLAQKAAAKMRRSREKTAYSADHLTKEAIPMEEPIPFPQQFSDTLEDATKEFLELLLRIGFAEEEQDDE